MKAKYVRNNFEYSSDTNKYFLNIQDLKKIIIKFEQS